MASPQVTGRPAGGAAPGAFERAQVLVLSSIDWASAWQRHQIFAAQFAASGHEVFFVENSGFRNPGLRDLPRLRLKLRSPRATEPLPPGLRLAHPGTLPPTYRAFRRANAGALVPLLLARLERMGLRPAPVVFAYFATATTLELIERLAPSALVYDCASHFSAHPHAPADFQELERRLLERADLVVADSDFLYARMRGLHPRVLQAHQGVSEEFFRLPAPGGPCRSFCYYGTWGPGLDARFVNALAEAGFEVTVSGYSKGPAPRFHPAVRRLDPAPLEELPGRLARFDAFLMPYEISPFHRGVLPAKVYECLASGRPALATPLPSLERFREHLYVAGTPEEWVRLARELPRLETPERRAARARLAREHTHAAEFSRLAEQVRAVWRPPAASAPAPARGDAWGSLLPLAEGFGWIGGLYALAKGAVVLSSVLAGRFLGPIEYGRANVVVAVAVLLSIVLTLGFPLALSKFVSEEEDLASRRSIISTALLSFLAWAAAAAAALLALGPALVRLLRVPREVLLWGAAYALLNSLHTVCGSPLLGLGRFGRRGVSELLYGFSIPVALGAMILAGQRSYTALVLSMLLGFAAGTAGSLWTLRRFLAPAFQPEAFRRIGRYAAVGTLGMASTAFVIVPARLVLHERFSAHEVGVFSAYFHSTTQVALTLGYMLNSILVPVASGPREQARFWGALGRWWPGLLAAAWACLLAGGVVILLLFGRNYPFHWPWLALFSGSAALVLLHGAASALLSARDFRGLCSAAAGWVAAGLGNLGLNLWLTPRWGIPGAGASLAAAYLLGLAVYALLWPRGGPGSSRA